MAKRKTLDLDAVEAVAVPQANPVERLEHRKAGSTKGQRSRIGKVPIAGYFAPELRDRLKILSVRTGRTAEDLIGDAIGEFLDRNGG